MSNKTPDMIQFQGALYRKATTPLGPGRIDFPVEREASSNLFHAIETLVNAAEDPVLRAWLYVAQQAVGVGHRVFYAVGEGAPSALPGTAEIEMLRRVISEAQETDKESYKTMMSDG